MAAEASHARKEGCNPLLILYSLLFFLKESKPGFLCRHVASMCLYPS